MKKIVALMLALVMVFALAACGSKPAASAPAADAKPVLVMGTSADYAPFEFMYPDDSGELVYGGIDVSVAQYIADYTGKELKVENMGFEYLLASLQKGDFDIVMAGMSDTEERRQSASFSDNIFSNQQIVMEATEERSKSADFSDPYYTDIPAKVLIRKADVELYNDPADLDGKSVGVQTSTTKEVLVKDVFAGANAVSLQNVNDLVNQLVNDKIDAVVLDGGVATSFAQSNADLAIANITLPDADPYCIAVAKGDPKGLLPGVNEAIADMLEKDKLSEFISFANDLEDVAQLVTVE